MQYNKVHTITVTTSNAVLATAATAFDADITTAVNNFFGAVPAGSNGALTLGDTTSYFDGTNYVFTATLSYSILSGNN